jgi:heptosyltransferase I
MLHRLRLRYPEAEITWVTGKLEAKLLAGLPNVRLIAVDKRDARSTLRQALGNTVFDALLLCQLSFRAGLLSRQIRARLRLGFDWDRSKELHSLFINTRISAPPRGHVLDAIGAFASKLGAPSAAPIWQLPIPAAAEEFADQHHQPGQRHVLLSPCSSHRRSQTFCTRNTACACC